MRLDLVAGLNEERRARRAAVVETRIDGAGGEPRLVTQASLAGDPRRQEIEAALLAGKARTVETADGAFFLNVHLPAPRLVVIGAVHVSQALAPMAQLVGYDVEIIDPRTAFASPERFAGVSLNAEWPEPVLERRPLDPYCALVAVTHDPKIDDGPIQAALDAGCFYVGALGSRKTHAKRVERLLGAGVGHEALDRIDAPIGLDIGAATPAEIAVSVLGAVISAFRKRDLSGR